MNLRKFFSRNQETANRLTLKTVSDQAEKEVLCDTSKLKELITKWTQNEGWKFENFATFVELTGIKTPIKLSDLNDEDYSFKCVTALNTEVTIHLYFGNWVHSSGLWVTEGEETRLYATNRNYERIKTVPEVILQVRTITRNGKELSSYYCKIFCHRTLKLDDTHMLKVEIDEPYGALSNNPDTAVLKNCQQVEEYLLSLDNSLVIAQVYDKVMELLGFSDEDISNSKKILFSYIETVGKEQRMRSKIFKKNGVMQEYAILENGETFHVSRNGSWKYLYNNTRIVYFKEQDRYLFSISGSEGNITTSTPSETMNRVKERISRLMDFVK